MKKKSLIIGILVVVILFMAINVNMSVRQESKGSTLTLKNLEALASPESGNKEPHCVSAKGFCFEYGVQKYEMTLLKW